MKQLSLFLWLSLFVVSCQTSLNDKSLTDQRPEFDFEHYDSLLPGKNGSRFDKELTFQKARAYYYKALDEEKQSNQHVAAFSDYLNALWMMDGLTGKRQVFSSSKNNVDYEHFTALIYDKLAWFFYTYDAWDVALECLELSSECFGKEDNPEGIASNLELMGDVMLAQGDKLGAVAYYKSSDSIHEQLGTNNIYQHFSSLFHRALDLYNMGEQRASYDMLNHALKMTDNDWMKRKVRFSLGYFYFESQQYDSALFSYEQSYPLLPRQTIKSYCRIIKAANVLGDSVKAAHYGGLLSDFYLERVALSGDKTRMVMMYETSKADRKDARQKDVFYFILSVSLLLVLVLVANGVLMEKRRRRHREEIASHEQAKARLEDEIVTTKKASRHKEERIKSLEMELKKAITNPDFQNLPFDKKLETLYAMPISKRVCLVKTANVKASASYPEMVLSENQMTTLVNAVDAVFPQFSVRIIKKYPRLKRFDVVYCCMYVLGITEVQAAALTGKTYQAVWTRSLKLHEIFENESNLQLFLHGLLKSW